MYFWKTETVVVLNKKNFCMSGRQRLLFSTNRISVCLRNREYCSPATRKSSPNPSYLHSGEFVLPWDAKNRSSHTQIVHIEIMRAQIDLKSDETGKHPTRAYEDLDPKQTNRLILFAKN